MESEGEFTLSADRALAKLSEFRLLHRSLYVVHLVAAAVAAGAEEFRVVNSRESIEFRFDKPVCSESELRGLLSAAIQNSAEPWKRELAIGLNGIQAFDMRSTVLESKSDEQAAYLRIKGEEIDIGPLSDPESTTSPGTRILATYNRSAGRLFEVLGQLLSDPPELRTLLEMCQYAPLRLWVDASRLDRDVLFTGSASMLAWRHISCPTAPLRVRKPSEERCDSCLFSEKRSQDFSAALSLDTSATAKIRGLKFVLNGVSFARDPEILGFPLACGVVNAPHLKTNLSHSDLVEDEAFTSVVATLQQEVREMVQTRCQYPVELLSDFNLREFAQSLQNFWEQGTAPAEVDDVLRQAELRSANDSPEAYLRLLQQAPKEDRPFWTEVIVKEADSLRRAWRFTDDVALRQIGARVALVPQDYFPKSDVVIEPFKLVSLYLGGEATLSPHIPWYRERQGLALSLGGFSERAVKKFQEIQAPIWRSFFLGTWELEQGRPERALPHLQDAAAGEASPFFLDELASLLLLLGRRREAYPYRIKAFETRSTESTCWPIKIAAECRGACPFSEWLKWNVKAGFQRVSESLSEAFIGGQTKWSISPSVYVCKEILEDKLTLLGSGDESRFFFHQAVWGLRRAGEWKIAHAAVCRRLMAHSMSLRTDKNEYHVPSVAIL